MKRSGEWVGALRLLGRGLRGVLVGCLLWGALCLCALSGGFAQGDAKSLPVNVRKGGVISKLPGYVTRWPDSRSSAITIGILGSHPVAELLKQLVAGQKVDGKPVRVAVVGSAAEAQDCQILFVPAGSEALWRSVRDSIDTSLLLTVGETPRFAEEGGGIIAFHAGGSDELELLYSKENYEKAKRGGLRISSRLLTAMNRAD